MVVECTSTIFEIGLTLSGKLQLDEDSNGGNNGSGVKPDLKFPISIA